MNFKEEEMPSNSEFYRVYKIHQRIDVRDHRFKRDLFNYDAAKDKEGQLRKIRCPMLGRPSTSHQHHRDDTHQVEDREREEANQKPTLISTEERKHAIALGGETGGERP